MTFEPRILQASDLDAILQLERRHLKQTQSDLLEMEVEMQEWHAPWRKESLEHYLPQGWSFGLFEVTPDGGRLSSYFLAQPQLFTRALTQTLWIEHFFYHTDAERDLLLEIAYKLSREKHFQNLVIHTPENQIFETALPIKIELQQSDIVTIKTSKM